MFRLLKIEYQKLRYNKASRVLTLIYFGLLVSIAGISLIKFGSGKNSFQLAKEGIYDFPFIWHFNTWIASLLKLFLLLIVVSMVANEYSYKTLKQNLIDGLSKKEFILSKFYTIIALAIISTVFVFIVTFLLGLNYSTVREFGNMFRDVDYLFAYFVKLLGFFSLGLFLSVLIKRSAFAVGAMLVWQIIELFTKGMFHWQFGESSCDFLSKILPLSAMQNLIKFPFPRLKTVKEIGRQVDRASNNNSFKEIFEKDYSVQYLDIAIVLVWTAIFVYLAYRLIQKRDL